MHQKLRDVNASATKRPTRVAVLPHINISEMTGRLLRKFDIGVAHKPSDTMRQLISRPKDKTDKMERRNVVYRIGCQDCGCQYIGQTGRKLSTRLNEHKAAIHRHDQLSLMSVHEDENGHKFDLQSAEVISQASTKHAREFLEAWFSNKHSINRHVYLDPNVNTIRLTSLYPKREAGETRLPLGYPAGTSHARCEGTNYPPPVTETRNLPVRLQATRAGTTAETAKGLHNQVNLEDKAQMSRPLRGQVGAQSRQREACPSHRQTHRDAPQRRGARTKASGTGLVCAHAMQLRPIGRRVRPGQTNRTNSYK